MQECAIVLGSGTFRESGEESGGTVRLAGKGQRLRGGNVFVSLLSREYTQQGKARLPWI